MFKKIRADCKDMNNAFMVHGAKWLPNYIPFCPTTAKIIPQNLISYTQAKTICTRLRKAD